MRTYAVRAGFSIVALLAGVLRTPDAYVYAQTSQSSTYGACSLAIANGQGNVTVSCITGSRIRIAAFELGAGTLDSRGEMEAFEEFIYRNDGKIVRMDVAFDKGMILHEEKNDLVQLTIGIEDPDQTCGGVTCGGTEYNIIVEPDDRDHGSPINFANGIYYVKGFFMPEGISGMHQGWLSTALRYVPDEHIILSDRYIVP